MAPPEVVSSEERLEARLELRALPDRPSCLSLTPSPTALTKLGAPRRAETTSQRTFPNGPGHTSRLGGLEEQVVPVLHVKDASRAVAWYERLGFHKEWEHQFELGSPWFVSVARGSVRLYLSEHKGDARPDTLIHLYVNDIDVVAAEFGIPVDEEGLAGRECDVSDPDGNRLRIATPRR